MPINIEIKAHSPQPDRVRQKLMALGAQYKGCDHQIDTYFQVPNGRLKLREGNIENNLIFYQRSNQAGPKQSNFHLFPVENKHGLKQILNAANGIKVVVDKKRHIYYIENVKFHVDEVEGLGSFVEIEAGDLLQPMSVEALSQQCDHYIAALGISKTDLIDRSYSDLLIEKNQAVD